MINKRANEWHGGLDIKRSVDVHTWETEDIPDQYGLYSPIRGSTQHRGILVGISHKGVRIRYPDYSHSKVQYLTTASTDLKSLAALFICGLVDPSILADRLEEDFSEHREAADILREYEKVKREQEIANGK